MDSNSPFGLLFILSSRLSYRFPLLRVAIFFHVPFSSLPSLKKRLVF